MCKRINTGETGLSLVLQAYENTKLNFWSPVITCSPLFSKINSDLQNITLHTEMLQSLERGMYFPVLNTHYSSPFPTDPSVSRDQSHYKWYHASSLRTVSNNLWKKRSIPSIQWIRKYALFWSRHYVTFSL